MLRPHQEEARQAILQVKDDRGRMHVICLPTGAGKSRTAATIVQDLVTEGFRVLWTAKDWRLLRQAVSEQTEVSPDLVPAFRRLGGDGAALGELPADDDGLVFFTTLHSWHARRDRLPAALQPSDRLLVVYDECHWALNSRLGADLLSLYLGKALLVGLTATPRENDLGQVRMACQIPFIQLCGTCLAEPVVREVPTGVEWRPVVQHCDIAARSLRRLGNDAIRNDVIVKELIEGFRAGRFRRPLVFACNVNHAETLAALVSRKGIAARALHSRVPLERQEAMLEDFKAGRVAALINVNQLAEGFDLPDIDAIFLARPTTSPVRLAQMIGRGARLTPDKRKFLVIEFRDVVRGLNDRLFHARQMFPARQQAPAVIRHHARPQRHFEPLEAPRFEELEINPYGTLTFARDQTFGVEIELTAPDGVPQRGPAWHRTARGIVNRLRDAGIERVHPEPLGYHGNEGDCTKWYVTYDSSAGWEVVSPVLANAEGFEELRRACEALKALTTEQDYLLTINHHTGLHVTLGTRLNTDARLKGFLKRLQRLEPGLYTLTSPSRLYEYDGRRYDLGDMNHYCMPVREAVDVPRVDLHRFVRQHGNRYYSVNVTHAHAEIERLEVRMHGGTTDFAKIAPWVSLWMLIFNHARYQWRGRSAPGDVLPGGNVPINARQASKEDIFRLLQAEDIYLPPGLETRLRRRRAQLRRPWARAVPRRVDSWARAGWYELGAA